MSKKHYIPDTNILIDDPSSVEVLLNKNKNNVIVFDMVLEELDNLKTRSSVSYRARRATKFFAEHHGKIEFFECNLSDKKQHLPRTHLKTGMVNVDNVIISNAINLAIKNPKKKYILLSNDNNVRLKLVLLSSKLDLKNISAQEYESSKVKSVDKETGIKEYSLSTEQYLRLYDESDEDFYGSFPTLEREYFVVEENGVPDSKRLFRKDKGVFKLCNERIVCSGVVPRNIEQHAAMEAMLNPEFDLVVLNGPQGTGKTFCAMAAAMHMSEKECLKDVLF